MDATFPQFVIGGSPRCGTTWLTQVLDRHPGVFMAKPLRPEPKFFLRDDLYANGLDWYRRTWFGAVPPGRIAGEKSANYFEAAPVADRLARDLPAVKLVFLLRDPVERAFSNYRWSRGNGLETEDFATALALEVAREKTVPDALRYARPHAYFSRGLYAAQLRPYLEHFGRDRIFLGKYERIAGDPEGLLTEIMAFLGVAHVTLPFRDLGKVNMIRTDDIARMDVSLRDRLRRAYDPSIKQLVALLGPEFTWW